jgi:hypothetical protein
MDTDMIPLTFLFSPIFLEALLMNPSDPETLPAKTTSSAVPVPPSFPKRIYRRMRYMSVGCCLGGAAIGGAIDGIGGAIAWALIFALLGAAIGLIMGAYAWMLETPLKGAMRVGVLSAAVMGLPLFIALVANQGWDGLGNAVRVSLMAAAMGAVSGALLGAFIAWLAGPIFREIVQKMDRGDSPFQSGR